MTHLSAAVKAGRLQIGMGINGRVRNLGRRVAQLQWHRRRAQQHNTQTGDAHTHGVR